MPGYADSLTRRARQWLALVVRECPERKHDVLWAAFTGVAVFFITFARDPSAWNSIWAEDGAVFLTGAVDQGFGSLFHFWAGYINTVPRVGALIAAAFPLSIAPAVMTTYAVAVVGICGATVEALSGAFIEGRWARVGLGLCFGFLPAVRVESIANMNNLQFFLVAVSFWPLLAIPGTKRGRRLSVVLLVATASSTIVGLVLLPLGLLRVLDRRSRMPAAVFLAVQVLHGLIVLVAHPARQIGGPISFSTVEQTFVTNVLAGQFFGGPFYALRERGLTLLALEVVAVALVVLLIIYRPRGVSGQLIVAAGALVLAGVTYVVETKTQGAWARYAVAPALFMLYGVAIVADIASRLKLRARRPDLAGTRGHQRSRLAWPLAGVMTLAVVLSWGFSYNVEPYRDSGPRWSSAYAAAKAGCRQGQKAEQLPILPVGWAVTLPCSAIASG
jgi:hypothetical protein